jgi:hypothetical protein
MQDKWNDQIRDRAYLIWLRSGRPEGCELDHWLQAEQELKAKRCQRRRWIRYKIVLPGEQRE